MGGGAGRGSQGTASSILQEDSGRVDTNFPGSALSLMFLELVTPLRAHCAGRGSFMNF